MILKLAATALLIYTGLFSQTSQPSTGELVYVALGDSVAAGIGSSLPRERSFAALLGEHYATHLGQPVRVLNLAVNGESSESFLSDGQFDQFRSFVDEANTSGAMIQAVTLTLGGNDVLDLRDEPIDVRSEALEAFRTAYPAALEAVSGVTGTDTPLFVSTIYDPTDESAGVRFSNAWWIEQFNGVIRDAVAQTDAVLVDLAESIGADARELTRYPADVHPTNAGHARMALEFWRAAALDTQPPVLAVLSASAFERFTPTIRFTFDPETDPSSIAVSAGDERVLVYPHVQVAPEEYVFLIDATASKPEVLEISIGASDVAGNQTDISIELTFAVNP